LKTHEIPALECLAIVFLVAWLASSPLERAVIPAESEPPSWQWWIPAAAFALAEAGSAGFFLLATRHIAAAEANLIVYLWPGIVVCLGAVLGIFHLKLRHIAGIALGFIGAAILIGGGELSLSFVGIGLALLAGLSWALYCVLRLKWRGATGPRSHWLQHSLIVMETSLAVVLLTCGGLLLETFQHLRNTDLGIRSEKLLTFETPLFRYKEFDRRVAFVNAQLEKVRAIRDHVHEQVKGLLREQCGECCSVR